MVFQLSRMMVAAVVVRQADLNLWKVEPPIFTLTQVSTTSSHPGNPAAPAKLLKVDMSPVPRAAPSPPGAVHLLLPATITSLSPRLPSSPPTLSPHAVARHEQRLQHLQLLPAGAAVDGSQVQQCNIVLQGVPRHWTTGNLAKSQASCL